MEEIIDFITNGSELKLSDLNGHESNDYEKSVTEEETVIYEDDIDDNDTDDDVDNYVPLAAVLDNTQNTPSDDNTNLQHHYGWRKRDTMHGGNTFVQSFSDPPDEKRTPLQYFREFIAVKNLETVINEANIYIMQKTGKSMNTNMAEVLSLICMKVMMRIVKLPSYKLNWSAEI